MTARTFDAVTDCPRCTTITAHVFALRDPDPNVEYVEITSLGGAEPTYLPTGPTEPYVRRECFTCGHTWAEDLP